MGCPVLCQGDLARTPFYIRSISTSIWSLEELCWFFEHYVPLIDESLVSSAMAEWIERELHLGELASALSRTLRDKENRLEFVQLVMKTAAIPRERRARQRERMVRFQNLPEEDRQRERGDALLRGGKYSAAMKLYQALLDEGVRSSQARAVIREHLGIARMHLFLYDEALADFREAYRLDPGRRSAILCILAIHLTLPGEKAEEAIEEGGFEEACIRDAKDLLMLARREASDPELPQDTDSWISAAIRRYHTITDT